MKNEVLHGLLTARTLFESAHRLCFSSDRHLASAGLVILQDGFELVAYCCLDELGVDEVKPIEKLSFDQLIGELRTAGHPAKKSGTLKSMNEQRVLIKHRAQLADPVAVQGFHEAALFAADKLLHSITGKELREIVIADAIRDPELHEHLRKATTSIEQEQYLEALIAVRKALYLALEKDYDVQGWVGYEDDSSSFLSRLGRGGWKAPFYTRSGKWIEENVVEPFDYVQIDPDRFRMDLIEAGIETVEIQNVRDLTPSVFLTKEGTWKVKISPEVQSHATARNVRYCLDITASALMKLQLRTESVQRMEARVRWIATLKTNSGLRRKPSRSSDIVKTLEAGGRYTVTSVVHGLDGQQKYLHLFECVDNGEFSWGYIALEDCEIDVEE